MKCSSVLRVKVLDTGPWSDKRRVRQIAPLSDHDHRERAIVKTTFYEPWGF